MAKFIPKFERKEIEEPSVVGALVSDGCKKWTDVNQTLAYSVSQETTQTFNTAIERKEVVDQDDALYFFWIDVFEKNGTVYLIGKVRVELSF